MARQRITYRTAAAGDVINDTFRNLRFVQSFNQPERTQRRERRGLEHDGVSGDQRRREFPRWNRRRKIPRCDQGDRAERFSDRVTEHLWTFGRDLIRELPRAFTAEVAKDVDRARDFADRFWKRFTFFARHLLAELRQFFREQFRGLE